MKILLIRQRRKSIITRWFVTIFVMKSGKFFLALTIVSLPCWALELSEDHSGGFMEAGLGVGSTLMRSKGNVAISGESPPRCTLYLPPSVPHPTKTDVEGSTGSIRHSNHQHGILGSFAMGYNASFHGTGFMAGIISGITLGSLSGKIPYPIHVVQGEHHAQNTVQKCLMRSKATFNAGVRLGWWWSNCLPFIKVGWSCMRTSFKPDPKASVNRYKGFRRFFHGLLLGAGWDVAMKSTILGLSADVALYHQRACVIFAIPQKPSFVLSTFRPVGVTVMATIKCVFPERKSLY